MYLLNTCGCVEFSVYTTHTYYRYSNSSATILTSHNYDLLHNIYYFDSRCRVCMRWCPKTVKTIATLLRVCELKTSYLYQITYGILTVLLYTILISQ